MTKSVKITKTIKIPAFLPLKYSKSPVYLMYQQASMQCIGDGALYNMFCYRHFCLLYSFFSRRSVIYRKNRFSLIKALLFLLRRFRLPAMPLCRKPHFFIVYFANIYFDMIELTEKIFFRQQRNAGSCFIFMFACFISRLALIVLRTICAYFLILQNSYFGFRFPFRCHRELGFLFDFKSRFYIFPLAYQ